MEKLNLTGWKVWCLVVLAVALAGCSFEVDADDQNLHQQIQGYWETVHMYEHEVWQYPGSEPDSYTNDFDVQDGDVENYGIIRIADTFVSYIATYDPEVEPFLNVPIPYTLQDGNLYSVLFSGDFTDHVSIEEVTDRKLVLKLVDVGTDEDGMYSDYVQIITFRRVEE